MNSTPETRLSLLIRVRDPADHQAWLEFIEIYRPVIIRLARRQGMQEADAEDVAQTVLISVAKSIESREHDRQQARFRTWLTRVARNAILNALMRRKPDRAVGGSDLHPSLDQSESDRHRDSELLRLEFRREVFRWGARQIKSEFEPATWDAFWLTTVEDRSCEDAAKIIGKPIGTIYTARSRVMRRLKEKVTEYDCAEGVS